MALITAVDPGSPAARSGLRAGLELLRISGHPIGDVLDYRFHSYEPRLTLTVADEEAREFDVSVRKEEGQDIGLSFGTELMDSQRACKNRCLFCFVDQLPPGLRSSLYFKDDDARMSFLAGQYITLTNLKRDEIERIVSMRVSPLHISVNATEGALRARMMGNPEAASCFATMRRLASAGITMHAQVVVCPGINDGAALRSTLEDLLSLCPAVRSVSVVPVGLTRWRRGLFPLKPFTGDDAAEAIRLVNSLAARCRARHGFGGVYAADELYLLAGQPRPCEPDYDGYPQLENGVGLMTSFEAEFLEALEDMSGLKTPIAAWTPFTVATGTAAAPFISGLLEQLSSAVGGMQYAVIPAPNRLFGESVSVAGLLCGGDVISALKESVVGERVLIPASMLRSEGDVFLDDLSPLDVSRAIGVPLQVVPVDGHSFVGAIVQIQG